MNNYSPFSLLNFRKLRSLLSFGVKGYLADTGWINSFDSRSPVDAAGEPIPWVTYSFIDFISPRLKPDFKVFEFGSGNSTFFYASRCAAITSVEHDKEWFETVKSRMPENSQLLFKDIADGGYSRTALTSAEKYDMIIVDGRDRVSCCKSSLSALSPRGVLVLDDSEREKYIPAIEFLLEAGFRHIPFTGISPGFFYRKSTSVFYREENCLGI